MVRYQCKQAGARPAPDTSFPLFTHTGMLRYHKKAVPVDTKDQPQGEINITRDCVGLLTQEQMAEHDIKWPADAQHNAGRKERERVRQKDKYTRLSVVWNFLARVWHSDTRRAVVRGVCRVRLGGRTLADGVGQV